MRCQCARPPNELAALISNHSLAQCCPPIQCLFKRGCCRLRRGSLVAVSWAVWRVTLGLQGSSASRAHPGSASMPCRSQAAPPHPGPVPSRLEWPWREGSPADPSGVCCLVVGYGLKWHQQSRKGREGKDGMEHSPRLPLPQERKQVETAFR